MRYAKGRRSDGSSPRAPETSLATFDRLAREDAEAEERAVESLVRALAEEQAARQKRERWEALGEMEPERVRALAAAGKLTPAEVEEWRAARVELDRRFRRARGMALAANLMGRAARVVRTLDGEIAVEVGRPGGHRSSWNGGFYGHLARTRE